MQLWQIKALELEDSGLKHLDSFIHEHALGFFIGAICSLLALLVWVLSGALRRKGGKSALHVRPGLFIHLPEPSRPDADTFDPFPVTGQLKSSQSGSNQNRPLRVELWISSHFYYFDQEFSAVKCASMLDVPPIPKGGSTNLSALWHLSIMRRHEPRNKYNQRSWKAGIKEEINTKLLNNGAS